MATLEDFKTIGDGCVIFTDGDVGINSVLIADTPYIPRVCEDVFLPGEQGAGRGIYKVTCVMHSYQEVTNPDEASPAKLNRVMVCGKAKTVN